MQDLLISPMLALSEHSVSVKGLYSSEGRSLGMALVQVANGADAEKVRSHCSGQIIDASELPDIWYRVHQLTITALRLTVQHVLPPTQPLPPQTVQPFVPLPKPTPPTQPKAQPSKGKATTPVKSNDKPPGLQLLQRMGKGGPPGAREKQAAWVLILVTMMRRADQASLLAQQKANMKLSASQPGKALLNRLNKPASTGKATPPPPANKKKGTPAGADKVSRAKAKANSSRMEVDEPARKSKERSAPKTQAELDDEMAAYERQRRFAAA